MKTNKWEFSSIPSPKMAKKMPLIAIVICSMMMLPSNANASWISIIKDIVSGVISGGITISTQKLAQTSSSSASLASSPTSQVPVANAAPTETEIMAAIAQFAIVCQQLSEQGFQCAIGEGRGTTQGNALKIASTRSIQELAKSMNTYVEGHTEDILKQVETNGELMDSNSFTETMTSTVKAEVAGSQIYFTYPYIEESNGKKIHVVKQVRVLNAALFGKALEETAQGKSISQQLIDEAKKNLANKAIQYIKKK